MKKIMLVLAMVAIVGAASAQEMSLGIKGGLNMSNLSIKDLKDNKMKLGFNVGIAADYEFAPSMAVQSGLFFTTKGTKLTDNNTVNMMYLQMPVHFAYKLDVAPATRVVFHAGPYVAYGVGGKMSSTIGKITSSVNTFDKNLGFKPFDAGLGLGVGAEFGQFLVDLGWDMGLVNISRDKNGSVKTQNAYLSVGYKF